MQRLEDGLEIKPEECVFMLGAEDPEMLRIEEVLLNHDLAVINVCHPDGSRVNPRTTYKAAMQYDGELSPVFVECKVDGIVPVGVIDHHQENDFGYSMGPDQYDEAASLGQLHKFLGTEMSHDDKVLAALDHCLADGLRDQCPGVSPRELEALKVQHIARTHHVTELAVRKLVQQYEYKILTADKLKIGDRDVRDLRGRVDLGDGYTLENLSMGLAQAIIDEPLIVQEADEDHRQKITIDSNYPEQIRAFMDEWAPEQGLTDVYGVPDRDYAGAYLPKTS